MELKDWIKAARKHAKLSGEQLGEKLGRTKGNISAWENGLHDPSFAQVMQISAATNFPIGVMTEIVKGAPPLPPAFSDAALRVAAIYDRVSPLDQQYIRAIAQATQSTPAPPPDEPPTPDDPPPTPAPTKSPVPRQRKPAG